ncbi:TetR/AcrR family transcriptional regulator [Mycobacterium hodleri]|uniref:TetR/AcrR family transcriptional regulator n=1 Tax=Mycolicibacterium hodleri TaxID=49897 RepID=UPI0021F317C5|nr:TetR/AcrR family transcriptional regulator [Mycolicibacterium hodleri]MCV7136002.1 TetR/AcrR family transcriptional regulator [Mycolicibacterium hodleri]
MAQGDDRPVAVARRRGRPVNSDSVETRNRILRASRQVVNERGYQAATFQAIAVAAGLSRPTLHYYFASREEIYQSLVVEAGAVVAELADRARRPATLVGQFAALVEAVREADSRDRSQIAFIVSARLESARNPELRPYASTGLRDCLATLVSAARARGELSDGVEVATVVDVLYAMLLGVVFYAGFVDDADDVFPITSQLVHLVSHGLVSDGRISATRCDTNDDTPSVVGGQL